MNTSVIEKVEREAVHAKQSEAVAIGSDQFSLVRDQEVILFLSSFSRNGYLSQGLSRLRCLTADPRSGVNSYVGHYNGSTLILDDFHILGKTQFSLHGERVDEARSGINRLIYGEKSPRIFTQEK